MPSAAPTAAIKSRLIAGAPTGVLIKTGAAFEEAPNPPQNFIWLEFPGGTSEQITIGAPGDNRFRDHSAFMTHIAVPRTSTCEEDARTIADQVAALYRGKTFDGVRCFAPYPAAEDTGPNGNYWGISFATPYEFDSIA